MECYKILANWKGGGVSDEDETKPLPNVSKAEKEQQEGLLKKRKVDDILTKLDSSNVMCDTSMVLDAILQFSTTFVVCSLDESQAFFKVQKSF